MVSREKTVLDTASVIHKRFISSSNSPVLLKGTFKQVSTYVLNNRLIFNLVHSSC